MINLDELLKELESNKEIEFERLEKDFNNDDVVIEMENFDKSFVEKWYVAMAGQKFAGHIWKTEKIGSIQLRIFHLLQRLLHKMNIQIKILFYIFCFSQKV